MEKTAHTTVPLHDLLARRWSPRAFAQRPVEPAKLTALFEAARWAPSCYNNQPWRFILATRDHPGEFERMLSCLVQANQVWAQHAPVLILAVAQRHFVHDGKPNAHAWHDIGLATENLIIQAMALNLHVHVMAGFDAERARELYEIPGDFDAVTAMAVGYLGNLAALPDDLRAREEAPRERRPLGELIFAGTWGQTAALCTL
jgi:nitroreductase